MTEETFEQDFQKWLENPDKRALREDIDRELRQEGIEKVFEKAKKLCPHGISELQCAKCYFDGPGYGK